MFSFEMFLGQLISWHNVDYVYVHHFIIWIVLWIKKKIYFLSYWATTWVGGIIIQLLQTSPQP